MSSVTYRNQPAIHGANGSVPVSGLAEPYTVSKVLWPEGIEAWISERLIGRTLHVCSGMSTLGDVRLDLYQTNVDVRADAARLPFADRSFDTVLCDPPYSGKFRWNHEMLSELHRVANKRIIFQHWYSPVDSKGQFKKAHVFKLTDSALLPYMPENTEFLLAFVDNGEHFVAIQEPSSEAFLLNDMAYWQPRTYFGRVQIISVMDRL